MTTVSQFCNRFSCSPLYSFQRIYHPSYNMVSKLVYNILNVVVCAVAL